MKETLMALCALTSILISCSEGEMSAEETTTATETTTEEPSGEGDDAASTAVVSPEGAELNVYKAPASTDFDDASLALTDHVLNDDGTMSFSFATSNYELGAQTADAVDRGCANSGKGQHIHFILNNQPYKAHYTGDVVEEVPEGSNTLLAFLSRSYHESVKIGPAAVLTTVVNGDAGDGPAVDIENDQILFYSRPKGSYKSSDGDKVLLDFYLHNCSLGDGHRVRATINGESHYLNEWAAYFIEGLGVGTHTVRLELVDANGDPVPGAYNDSGDREFSITAD